MKKVNLGKTDINVSRVGMGVLPIGHAQLNLPISLGAEVINYAIDNGINFIDTAQYYEAYPYIKEALDLRSKRALPTDHIVICSKSLAEGYDDMLAAIYEAREALGRDVIDIFLMHEVRTDDLAPASETGCQSAAPDAGCDNQACCNTDAPYDCRSDEAGNMADALTQGRPDEAGNIADALTQGRPDEAGNMADAPTQGRPDEAGNMADALTQGRRAGALEALLRARELGLVRAIGLSTHHVDVAEAAAALPELDVVFPLINYAGLGIRRGNSFASADEMVTAIKLCHQAGKGVFAMKALGGGPLTGNYQRALDFVFSIPEIDSVMLGFGKTTEIDDIISYLNGTMDPSYQPDISKKRVHINHEDCEGCGACKSACPAGAIYYSPINGLAEVDQSKCLTCGYCSPVCPVRAVIMY